MLNLRNDNTTAVTYDLLSALKVPTTKTFLAKELRSHPYYPSLAAVSDILNTYKVENAAMRISTDELDTIQTPFIAHLNSHQGAFALVEKITQDEVHVTQEEKANKVYSKSEFIKIWDKIILTAKADDTSIEPDFKQTRKDELLTAIKLPLLFIAIALILIATLVINQSVAFYLPLFITKVTGLFFIWLLVKHELGEQSDLTDKLCTMTKSAGCNEVLNSKASRLFGLVELADMGLVWFVSSFLFLLINSFKEVQTADFNILGWFAMLSLPFIVFSISYQAFVVKKYCPLCLGVMSMLLAEAILFITFYHFSFELPALFPVLLLLSILSVVVYVWAVIKPYLMNREKLFNLETQYLHLKRNPLVINSILAEGSDYNIAAIPNPVRITDHETGIVITEIINPYCKPCEKAFRKTEQLINEMNGQCPVIQFAFLTQAENQDNMMTKTAMHLLALSEISASRQMKQALSDWFSIMDYEKWSIKYPAEINESHLNTLKNHAKWVTDNNIEGTPTSFINTKKISSKIDLSDLRYIME
jgi:uncharacterized membrane protein